MRTATKRKYGQYFTIKPIADFMVSLVTHDKTARVLEPSCGEGVFLHALSEQGFHAVAAYEIDPTLGKEFSCVRHASFVSSPIDERFDVIIGNPPYIRWKHLEPELKDELAQSPLWNAHFNSLCDYLYLFILKSIEQLTDGGELIFICSDYWLNSTHSHSLRQAMLARGTFTDIYRFKEAPLFDGVTASLMIFRYVKGNIGSDASITLHEYVTHGRPILEDLLSHRCFTAKSIPQFQDGKRWLLTDEMETGIISKLETVCAKHSSDLFQQDYHRIGDVCDIGNGMVSGLDKAFRVPNVDELNEDERRSLIPVYKAKDLVPLIGLTQSFYFFIRDTISSDTFVRGYPHFAKQVQPLTALLRQRYNYGRPLNPWEFAFPRNERLFASKRSRIFVPCKERISNKNYFRFAFAGNNVYPLQDVTCIMPKPSCRESIFYVLGYLNTPQVFTWLKHNGIVKGDIVEFSEAPIASIPYRAINWDDPIEVERHNAISEVIKSMIAAQNVADIHAKMNALFKELLQCS